MCWMGEVVHHGEGVGRAGGPGVWGQVSGSNATSTEIPAACTMAEFWLCFTCPDYLPKLSSSFPVGSVSWETLSIDSIAAYISHICTVVCNQASYEYKLWYKSTKYKKEGWQIREGNM